MLKKKSGITAQDLLAKLATDPAYQALREAKDRELADIADQRRREQQPLLDDLASVGVQVDHVYRLLEMPDPDQRIYPILLVHITKPYSIDLLDWIGRAMGRKAARPTVWDALINIIKSDVLEGRGMDGAIAAISEMARPGDLSALIELLGDRSLGSSRILLVRNLTRSKRPEARAALLRLQADSDLKKEITIRLSRSRG